MKTGDHGTFTLGDSKIVGTVRSINPVDTTPKPLPTEPGIYVRGDEDLRDSSDSAIFYVLSGYSTWMNDETGEWMEIAESEVPTDLVPLVKGTR